MTFSDGQITAEYIMLAEGLRLQAAEKRLGRRIEVALPQHPDGKNTLRELADAVTAAIKAAEER